MKNWLVTGVSSGLGRALANEVLAVGDSVIGTVRTASMADWMPLTMSIKR